MQAAICAFTPLFLALLTHFLFGARAGRIAGIIGMISADIYFLPIEMSTEAVFVPMLLLGLGLLAMASERERGSMSLASGAVFGLAALIRTTSQYCMPLFILWLLWPFSRKRRAVLALWFVAGFFAMTLPWALRNSILYHRPFWIDNVGQFNVLLMNPELEAEVRRQLPPTISMLPLTQLDLRRNPVAFPTSKAVLARVGELAQNPNAVWDWFYHSFRHHHLKGFWLPSADYPEPSVVAWIAAIAGDLTWVMTLLLAGIGFAMVRRHVQTLPFLWIIGNVLPLGLVVFIARRYGIPFSLTLIPFAAAVLVEHGAVLCRTRKIVAVAGLALMMALDLPLFSREYSTLDALSVPASRARARVNGVDLLSQWHVDHGARIRLARGWGVLGMETHVGGMAAQDWALQKTGSGESFRRAPGDGGRVVFAVDPVPASPVRVGIKVRLQAEGQIRVSLNGDPLRDVRVSPDWDTKWLRVRVDTWKPVNILELRIASEKGPVDLQEIAIDAGAGEDR